MNLTPTFENELPFEELLLCTLPSGWIDSKSYSIQLQLLLKERQKKDISNWVNS